MIIEKVTNTEDFSELIESIRYQEELSYMDAIIFYCEQLELEVESVTKLMSKSMIAGLYKEALALNLMKDKHPVLV